MWLTDCGRHQVLRLDASGNVDWEWGVFGEPGHDEQHLCLPTNVDTDATAGTVYISDGYCNSRVVHVDIATRRVLRIFLLPESYGQTGSTA